MSTTEYIDTALSNAPPAEPVANPQLIGWWIGEGYYLCGSCAGRIFNRGLQLPEPTVPVYRNEPYGSCCGCE